MVIKATVRNAETPKQQWKRTKMIYNRANENGSGKRKRKNEFQP